MASTIQVGDLALVRTYCYNQSNQQLAINDFWYRCSAIIGAGADDADFIDQWSLGVGPFYQDLMHSQGLYQGASVNLYRGANVPTLTVKTDSGNGAGTTAGNEMPSQVRGILHKQTNVGGARGRGRVYTAFMSAADNALTGTPTAGYQIKVDNLGTFADTQVVAVTGVNTSTLDHVLVNRNTRAYIPIVQSVSTKKWGTQKRSGDYGRTNTPFVP